MMLVGLIRMTDGSTRDASEPLADGYDVAFAAVRGAVGEGERLLFVRRVQSS